MASLRSATGALPLLLTAFLGAGLLASGGGGGGHGGESSSAAAEGPAAPVVVAPFAGRCARSLDPLCPLAEYLGLAPDAAANAAANAFDLVAGQRAVRALDTLVALVPDPIHSPFAYEFD